MKKLMIVMIALMYTQTMAQGIGGYGEQHTRDSSNVILPNGVFGGEFDGTFIRVTDSIPRLYVTKRSIGDGFVNDSSPPDAVLAMLYGTDSNIIALTEYQYGMSLHFRHPLKQFEFHGWDGLQYRANLTLITGTSYNEVQVRNQADTKSIQLNFPSGADACIRMEAAQAGTDVAGENIIFAAGTGTGAGTPGTIYLRTAKALASGTTAQTAQDRIKIDQDNIIFYDKAGNSDVEINQYGELIIQQGINTGSTGIDLSVYTGANERIKVTGGTGLGIFMDAAGSVGINTTTLGSSAAGVFGIGNGTAPTTFPADMVQFWSTDSFGVAGHANAYVANELGEITQISEHAEDAPEWMYDEFNDRMAKVISAFTGVIKYTNKDRDARLSQLERLKKPIPKDTLKLITFYQESFAQYNKRTGRSLEVEDWDANQNANYANRQKEIIVWTKKKIEHVEKLNEWKRSKIPLKDRIEAPVFNNPQPKVYLKKQKPRFLRASPGPPSKGGGK